MCQVHGSGSEGKKRHCFALWMQCMPVHYVTATYCKVYLSYTKEKK